MSNFAAAAAEAGDKYLQSLADGQARIIEYVRASREFMPQMPEAPMPASAMGLPSLKDVAELQFGFATRMLEQQHKFMQRLYTLSSAQPAKPAKPTARTASSSRSAAAPARKTKTRRTKAASKPRSVN